MAKFIKAVHYSDKGAHDKIERVKICELKRNNNGKFVIENCKEESVQAIIVFIRLGNSVKTLVRKSRNLYYFGEDVHIVTSNGCSFIRTDRNNIAVDNLENVDEY